MRPIGWMNASSSLANTGNICDQDWVANGINNSIADLAFGFSDLLRVGTGLGSELDVMASHA